MMTVPQPQLSDPAPVSPAADGRPVAVVVGAGFGGLAAAVRLGAKGWRCVVVDRLDEPGGRATARREKGYRLDLGPTIVTAPHLFEDLWTLAGRRMSDDVELRALDPFYEIRFPDGTSFSASADMERMRAEVARLSPGDVAGWERFLKDGERRYGFGFEGMGRKSMHDFLAFAKTLPTFVALRADRSVHAHAARRVKDPRLRMALSFHPLFIGGDPFRVTSIYSLVAFLEKTWGVHCVVGGCAALAEGLAGLVRGQGGALRLGAQVDEITVKNGRAAGVRLADGEEIAADIVVSGADAGHTYMHLLRDRPRRRWTDRRLKRSRWSMGLYVWHFGTKGTRGMWPDIGHHTILNGPRYEGLVRDIFRRGHLAEDMSIYLHRPSVTDPTAAPEGGDSFYALSPVPHLGGETPADWAREAEPYKARVQAILEKHIPGFAERIEVSHVMTPEDFRDRYLSPFGTGFSLEPRIFQSAWFRPHNVSEELPGLYLVGAGTHPGAGLPGVISSAEAVSKLIPAAVEAPR
jgi:phytoene desaturase